MPIDNVLEFTSHSYDGHMFDKDMNKVPFPKDRYRVDALTDFAMDYLHTRDGKRPFFLFLSYVEPHHQNDHDHFEGPRGSKEKYKNFPDARCARPAGSTPCAHRAEAPPQQIPTTKIFFTISKKIPTKETTWCATPRWRAFVRNCAIGLNGACAMRVNPSPESCRPKTLENRSLGGVCVLS